jgi:hypothetical protein
MSKSIKFSLFLLVAGIVAAVSCGKTPTPDPESEAKLFSDPANCFMVNEPGFYTFKTVKGKTQESVGDVAKVEVLWESFGTHEAPSKGNIVSQAYFKDGQIYFKTPATLKDGNAVIAAKDASNNILWSWHIWVCNGWDATATAQKYYNKSNGIASWGAVMDRNLGATSATVNDHKAHGLLYQWGRKDPFLGWDGYNAEGHTPAASTLKWPDPVKTDEETGTIEYAIAHPTTILYPGKVSSNVDWYFTKEHNVTDNMRWNERLNLYDPCPAGWTLPEARTTNKQGLWYNALGQNWNVVYDTWDVTKLGINLGGKLGDADPIWYPEVSLYYYEDGQLYRTRQVYVWSRNVAPAENDGLPIFKFSEGGSGGFDPEQISMDVTAYTMFCQKNAQDHTEAWAATHCFRSLALPTRCVAVK